MIKKTIAYQDFNGEDRTATHHFHLTEADITLYEYSRKGGMAEYLQSIVNTQEIGELLNAFKEIVDLSYGVRSADGRNFSKSPEALAEFQSSGAYSALYMELATNTEMAVAFVNGIMPKERNDHKKAEVPRA